MEQRLRVATRAVTKVRNSGHPAGSYYKATATPFPALAPLSGDITADVCVVGAGYTGLGAALELASRGVSVVVLEQAEVGSGGSGRNGGQVHSGHRRDQDWLENAVGDAWAFALWRLAEDARNSLLDLIRTEAIACDFKPGVIHARTAKGKAAEDAAHVARMASRYRYDQLEVMDRRALAEALGTEVYEGGIVDHGGGHLHALNLTLGLARTALAKGAAIHERSEVLAWHRVGRRIAVATGDGQVTCDQLILTGDGYVEGLSPVLEARVAPINNFIAVTEPLNPTLGVLPGDQAVADDRFVVNYFRKTADGRLLFGGGETYTKGFPEDIAGLVRGHMLKVYPQLAQTKIDYAWGGTLGITLSRAPFVGEVAPGVWSAAGYSGQGVALAPYFGKLLAQATLGERAGVELLARLPTPPFPGGRLLRGPVTTLGLSWYRLRDRLGWTA